MLSEFAILSLETKESLHTKKNKHAKTIKHTNIRPVGAPD